MVRINIDYFQPKYNGWVFRVVSKRIGELPILPYRYIALYLGCIVLGITIKVK